MKITYTRDEALQRIREFLGARRQGGETTCQTAARLGLYCHGYDQWNAEQLRELYPWLAERFPDSAAREDLLQSIVAWDGARMLLHNAATTCDAKAVDHEGCLGFDRFSNTHLKRLFPDLFQPQDEIVSW